ncbi:pyridoxamine 5'-phosphate oxidase family protein [Streptomyces sulphureus]|uniref:pyridoxamine 5'-phosphate oxidase family protein n=1 Tax=Streptomyces sulphureus TaxID=47758 RepID=UPI0003829F42|nr:pyridoxamine 5'-phosphate oxidase family protein [Streptomyces sulphureus]
MAEGERRPGGGPRRRDGLPGSEGEHELQRRMGTSARAEQFYQEQVLDHLNARMQEFTRHQEMFFLATSDAAGACDCSFRAGPPGFVHVVDEYTLVYPEYRGNGVHASLGNLLENPQLGLILVDFTRARIGLHINGRGEVVPDAEVRAALPTLPVDPVPGRHAELWVRVSVEEAYIHCAKHIPHLQKAPGRPAREWGTDDYKRKGGDFFGAARSADERSVAADRHVDAVRAPQSDRTAALPLGGSAQQRVAPSQLAPPPKGGAPHPEEPTPDTTMALRQAELPSGPRQPSPSAEADLLLRQAQQALAEARRRGQRSAREPDSFHGWFG